MFEAGMDVFAKSKLFIKWIEKKVLDMGFDANSKILSSTHEKRNLITLFESFDRVCAAVFVLFNELDASVASSAKLFFSSDCWLDFDFGL